jgi:hypothetical protein
MSGVTGRPCGVPVKAALDPEKPRHLGFMAGESRLKGRLTGFCVALETQHDLGRSVPASSDVLGHVSCVLFRVHGEASCQAKIADLELAVGVYKKVTGLEVAMEDVGGMDVLETA